jgi:uncharacterized protein YceK
MSKLCFYICISSFWVLCSSGCSTLRTVPHFTLNSPKLYSGTRMDLDAMKHNKDYVLKKYNVDAPSNPKLDLPFSFLMDTVVLPVVFPVALSDAIFE